MNDIKTGVCALMAKQVAEEKKILSNKRRLKSRVLASKKLSLTTTVAVNLTSRQNGKTNGGKLNKIINGHGEETSQNLNGKKRLYPL